MQYRDFRYSNEFGQVDLQRGSIVGMVLSWVLVKALQFSLLGVVAGIGYSGWKYFVQSTVEAKPIAAPVLPVMDYAGRDLRPTVYQPVPLPRLPAPVQHPVQHKAPSGATGPAHR